MLRQYNRAVTVHLWMERNGVRKLIISLALLAACRSSQPVTTTTTTPAPTPVVGNETGAPDGLSAVRGFLAAAKSQDIQALGAMFGDQEGAARGRIPREELDKRALIMMRCLRHDRYEIAGDAPGLGGSRAVVVNLTLGTLSRSSNFQVVLGPENRWYVKEFDMGALQDICTQRG
jgi:hypothetical protein